MEGFERGHLMVGNRGTLRDSKCSSSRCFGAVSGFLLKLIRESTGWESGRRPLAALRAADLVRLRVRLLRRGAQPTLFAVLDDAIHADLIIAETVQAGGRLGKADGHPLGATVHHCTLSSLITWPFTGIVPTQVRDLMTSRARRGPVPDRPTLAAAEQESFFDHLLVTADAIPREDTALARRQSIYMLGFDGRASTSEWLRVEHSRAMRDAGRTDQVPSWVVVRSSAVALANGGDREPLRAFLRHALATNRLEQANLNYWAYWVREIEGIQVDDAFMGRIDPQGWSGGRLLTHLLELLHPGSGQAELDLHTVWALLLAHPSLLSDSPRLRSATSSRIEELAADRDLSVQARRELSDIAYAVRLAHR